MISEETRQRMSAAHKGRTAWNKGRKETRPEVLARISTASKRARKNPRPPATEETRNKISETKRAQNRPAWNSGLKMDAWTDERRAKHYAALARPRALTGSKELGVSASTHQRLHEMQKGCCAMCGAENHRMHIDHDHTTGKVRGLLCGNCNRGLGLLGEDVGTLMAAIFYLSSPPINRLT